MESSGESHHQKPKLRRTNALKKPDYKPFRSAPGSPAHSPLLVFEEPAITKSLGSFRIQGVHAKEEIEKICSFLGLPGPEALAIPSDEWNVRKGRLQGLAKSETVTEEVCNGAKECTQLDEIGAHSVPPEPLPFFPEDSEGPRVSRSPPQSPSLAPSPTMSLQKGKVIDDETVSTWEIVRLLAPEDDGPRVSFADTDILDQIKDQDQNSSTSDSCRSACAGEEDSSSSSFSADNAIVYYLSPEARFKVPIRFWSKGHVLGSGSFGTVYEGISDTGSFFAIKEVSLVEQGHNARQCISQLQHEIALLSQFEHQNIVQYLGTDQEADRLYIFLELVPQGSLAALYQKYSLGDSQVRAYTRQILTGLKYLHDQNIVHRDIKCANILVDSHGLIKLADFGLAKQTSKLNELKSCKGSAYWMAPEVIDPRKSYWLPADIWSLGCTVLEMLCRKPPHSDLEWQRVLWKVGHGEPPVVPSSLSKDAKNFIYQCLRIDPYNRPTAADLLNHPFVKRSMSEDLSSFSTPGVSLKKVQST